MPLTRVSGWCATKLLGSTFDQYFATTMIVVYILSTVTQSATITPNPGRGEVMQVQPDLFFDGRCEEAVEFYRRTLGAEMTMLVRF